jgi:FtsH-binding integral membrane protein
MSWNQSSFVSADVRDVRVTAFLSKVYGWMFLGLLVTAGTAVVVASSPALIETLILNRILFWILLFGQLGLVFYLSARVDKVSPVTAAVLFMVYSAMVGVTSSVIFLIYTGASIVSAFMVAGGTFGAMAVFGSLTKRSLAGVGQFMFMGLIGLIIASGREYLLVQRRADVRDQRGRRAGIYRPNCLGCAATQTDGCGAA